MAVSPQCLWRNRRLAGVGRVLDLPNPSQHRRSRPIRVDCRSRVDSARAVVFRHSRDGRLDTSNSTLPGCRRHRRADSKGYSGPARNPEGGRALDMGSPVDALPDVNRPEGIAGSVRPGTDRFPGGFYRKSRPAEPVVRTLSRPALSEPQPIRRSRVPTRFQAAEYS